MHDLENSKKSPNKIFVVLLPFVEFGWLWLKQFKDPKVKKVLKFTI